MTKAAAKKPSSAVRASSGSKRSAARQSFWSRKRTVAATFIVVFGVLGSVLLFLGHADLPPNCVSTQSSNRTIEVCTSIFQGNAVNATAVYTGTTKSDYLTSGGASLYQCSATSSPACTAVASSSAITRPNTLNLLSPSKNSTITTPPKSFAAGNAYKACVTFGSDTGWQMQDYCTPLISFGTGYGSSVSVFTPEAPAPPPSQAQTPPATTTVPTPTAPGWTWDSATHPAGSANVGGGTSGAGVWYYHGYYYIPGVGHMDQPVGLWKGEGVTGTGGLGYVSNTTYTTAPQSPDIGLIATGTKPLSPNIRVSNGWTNAPITDIAHGNGDLPAGKTLCQSGYSSYTAATNGYNCGTLTQDCTTSSTLCVLYNPNGMAYGGDSGGAVWDYDNGGVELIGWEESVHVAPIAPNGEYEYANFVPVWVIQNYQWTSSQTWQGAPGIAPFPSGNDGSGCFVTTSGCVKA